MIRELVRAGKGPLTSGCVFLRRPQSLTRLVPSGWPKTCPEAQFNHHPDVSPRGRSADHRRGDRVLRFQYDHPARECRSKRCFAARGRPGSTRPRTRIGESPAAGGHGVDISGEEILCEPEGESHAPPSVSRIEYVAETAALQATPGRGRGAMGSRIRLTKPPGTPYRHRHFARSSVPRGARCIWGAYHKKTNF